MPNNINTVRLGYCFRNLTLNLHSGPLNPAVDLSVPTVAADQFLTNCKSLQDILAWNSFADIGLFRLSENWLPPVLFNEDLQFLVQKATVPLKLLHDMYIFRCKQRMLIHVPSDARWSVKNVNFLKSVRRAAYALALLQDNNGVIECHLGYIDPQIWRQSQRLNVLNKIIETVNTLPDEVKRHLAFENDKTWSVEDTVYVAENTGCKIIYDIMHHKIWPNNMLFTHENIDRCISETMRLAKQSHWPGVPLFHISSQHPVREPGYHDDLIAWSDYVTLRESFVRCKTYSADILFEAGECERAIVDTRASFLRQRKVDNLMPIGQENKPQ